MEFNAYAGQRVLYKTKEHGWQVGELFGTNLKEDGLYFYVHKLNDACNTTVPIENIFFDTRKLEDWELEPGYGILIRKEDFIEDIKEGRVSASEGTAYMSDGEYQYYSVPRLNENWLNKQPFDYVVWID